MSSAKWRLFCFVFVSWNTEIQTILGQVAYYAPQTSHQNPVYHVEIIMYISCKAQNVNTIIDILMCRMGLNETQIHVFT